MPEPGLVRPLPPGPLDVVADVHGELGALDELLAHLGYRGATHPDGRRLVFVGDLVDRGPDSVGVVRRVRDLMDAGAALCVLGNHELNALRELRKKDNAWFHELPAGTRAELLRFFAALPVALERDDLRVVHACWDAGAVAAVRAEADAAACVRRHEERLKARAKALDAAEWADRDRHWRKVAADLLLQNENPVKLLTSGPEARAAEPFEANGELRDAERVRWWADYVGPLCVVGHYWRARGPGPSVNHLFDDARPHALLGRGRVMCIDYSAGWRFKERDGHGFCARHRLRLAALRVPELTLAFNDGEAAPVAPAVDVEPWPAWRDRAREYRAAAQALPPGRPRTFLALHAAELLLKAVLLRDAAADEALVKTHDLARLIRTAGLRVREFRSLVEADPRMTALRYPKPERPGPDPARVEAEADALWARLGDRLTG